MKKIKHVVRDTQKHWVGDGFHVRSIFGYNNLGQIISPFLLMDYAEPVHFQPVGKIRGVGEHPHRGFETVTIVYDGEVEHRDSHGGGGKISKGDVQWMTAASGLVHEEFHSKEFSKTGGPFEMIQLWVNLPAKDKMAKPRYQGITDAQIPAVKTETGTVRVIAGEYAGSKGPAQTFTPMNMWDVRLKQDTQTSFQVPTGHTTLVFVLSGDVEIDNQKFSNANLIVLETMVQISKSKR